MSKHSFEDIVPVKRQKKEQRGISKNLIEFSVKKRQENNTTMIGHTSSKSRFGIWFIAFISIGFCLFAFSFLFGKAEIRVNPKIKDVVLDENITANKTLDNDRLSFNVVVIAGEESKTILATEQKEIQQKATGTVIIFNTYSTSPQPLNIDSRLEGSNGKIYKTSTKVIIPGENKNGVPGQAEVKIYAAEAGDEYNSDPLDFKILGFKGTSKYTKFYGRSKTGTKIASGFVGKAPVIKEADKVTTINNLKNSLQEKLFKKAQADSNGLILFKKAVVFNADETNLISTYNTDNSMTLTLKGTLSGILLDERKLTKKIATNVLEKYDNSDVFIPNIQELNFTLTNKDSVSLADAKNVNFNLSGSAQIVWRLDVAKFTVDFLSKAKGDFNKILANYPNIDSANLILTPMWRFSFPDKSKDIKIIVNYPQ